MGKRNQRPVRSIENLLDDDGQITHLKCSECCWKVPVKSDFSLDDVIRSTFASFTEHNCDDHRIGSAFRKTSMTGEYKMVGGR